MKLSLKTDYACRAVEALALHHPNARPLRIEEIARRQAIPVNYLVQILIELKGQGLIRSHRGKAGGYVLAKSPREVSVGDVVRAIHGELVEISGATGAGCPQEIRRVWERIKAAAEQVADTMTFEEICAQSAGRGEMYYI
jgi:Rrf2 family protein